MAKDRRGGVIPHAAEFIARGGYVTKSLLDTVDKQLKKKVKDWLFLPKRESAEVVYLTPAQGGVGILPIKETLDISTVLQAFRMLGAKDPFVSNVAKTTLTTIVKRKMGRTPTEKETCDFLNGTSEEPFNRQAGDIRSLWTRTRTATKELAKKNNMRWTWNATRKNYEIAVPITNQQPEIVKIHPLASGHLAGLLKWAARQFYLDWLLKKPDQGKVHEVAS